MKLKVYVSKQDADRHTFSTVDTGSAEVLLEEVRTPT